MVLIKKISVVVSVYNEDAVLDKFYQCIKPVLESCGCDYELLFVDDGSRDTSLEILHSFAKKSSKVKVVSFSRNFGHEAAMVAGIDHSSGDGIICMDADLQHPVECIPQIIEKFNDGFEVVTMVRTANKSVGIIKKITSNVFYKIMNSVSEVKLDNNASDFFALTREPAQVLREQYRETKRFLRAYIQSIGFKKTSIEYEANERAAGKSKYSIKKLIKFSIQALLSFSDMPLRLATICGAGTGVVSFALIIYIICVTASGSKPSSLSVICAVICFLFAVLFVIVGIIGEYLSLILSETRKRPIYIVGEKLNLDKKGESK